MMRKFLFLTAMCMASATFTEDTSVGSTKDWTSLASSSDGTKLVAGIGGGNIWTSSDSGATWTEDTSVGSPKYWQAVASSSDGKKLAAVVYNENIWTSADSGATWTEVTSVGVTKSWYGITSSLDGTKLAVFVRFGNIWTSTNSGATWMEDTSVGATKDWRAVTSSSDGTKLVAVVYGGNCWTSADSGATWTENTSTGATKNWRAITSSSDGTKLAAAIRQGNIWTSTNSGATWTEDTSVGAPQNWRVITSSADGTKLVAAVYRGNIWTSTDSGATWTEDTSVGSTQRWHLITSSSDGTKLAAAVCSGNIWTSLGTPQPPAPPAQPPAQPPPPPPPPPPPMPPGYERVCECSDERPRDSNAIYCAPPLRNEPVGRDTLSDRCRRGLPMRLSCAKCDHRVPYPYATPGRYKIDNEYRSHWDDKDKLQTLYDFDDGKIDHPQRFPRYVGDALSNAVANLPADACTIPEDVGWTSNYRPSRYSSKTSCYDCLKRLPGGRGYGSPWSPFSYCFAEPDPAQFPNRYIRQVYRQGGDGVCADRRSRDAFSWSDRISQTRYTSDERRGGRIEDTGPETKDAIYGYMPFGTDCADCGPRCGLKKPDPPGCFHAGTQLLHRTPAGEILPTTVSSLTIDDEVLVWDPVAGAPVWAPVVLFWLRPAGDPPTSCAAREERFVNITYELSSGERHHFVVTATHYVELPCNDTGTQTPLTSVMQGACGELADNLFVGAMLSVWPQGSTVVELATVVAVDRFSEAMAAFMPLTSKGLAYVLAGGAIVPIDSETPTLSGEVIPRRNVLLAANTMMAAHNFIQKAFPTSWSQAFEALWLSPEPSVVFGECIETVKLSNQMALTLNTSNEAISLLNDPNTTVPDLVAWLATFVRSVLSSTPPGYAADANASPVVPLSAASLYQDAVLFQGGSVDGESGRASESLAEVTSRYPNGGLGQNISGVLSPLGTANATAYNGYSCMQDDDVCQEEACFAMAGQPCQSSPTPLSPPLPSPPSPLSPSTEDVSGLSAGAIAGILVGGTVLFAAIVLGTLRARKRSKSALVRVQPKSNTASATVAALPVAALPAAPQPAHSRVGEGTGSNEGTAKADKDPPPPTEHVVADSVFSIVAGPRADSISIAALSKWLIQRGDIPLDKIQALFSAMDTDGNGSIDRQEWRVGFTAGLVQND